MRKIMYNSVITSKEGESMVNLADALTTKTVAEMLGVSDRTVRSLCNDKQITHYRIGTKIVILPEDLRQYIENLKVEKEIE